MEKSAFGVGDLVVSEELVVEVSDLQGDRITFAGKVVGRDNGSVSVWKPGYFSASWNKKAFRKVGPSNEN